MSNTPYKHALDCRIASGRVQRRMGPGFVTIRAALIVHHEIGKQADMSSRAKRWGVRLRGLDSADWGEHLHESPPPFPGVSSVLPSAYCLLPTVLPQPPVPSPSAFFTGFPASGPDPEIGRKRHVLPGTVLGFLFRGQRCDRQL